jgi:hypothetical protein
MTNTVQLHIQPSAFDGPQGGTKPQLWMGVVCSPHGSSMLPTWHEMRLPLPAALQDWYTGSATQDLHCTAHYMEADVLDTLPCLHRMLVCATNFVGTVLRLSYKDMLGTCCCMCVWSSGVQGDRKKSVSRASKAGLQFPVGRLAR